MGWRRSIVAGSACLALAGCGSTTETTTTMKTPPAYSIASSAAEAAPKPIPSGVSRIRVRATYAFAVAQTINGPSAVAEAISLIDSLRQVRPGEALSCPLREPRSETELTVELQFGKPLPAVAPAATVEASEPACDGLVEVAIEGEKQPERFGARSVIKLSETLLGVKLREAALGVAPR
jgi:hypothetical protein